ncbi:MAG: hypothetical protein Q9168_000299 [Polycauliona sp. 1 TL-2023]
MADRQASSDEEFILNPEEIRARARYANLGAQSIDRLVDNAVEDRSASKHVDKLQHFSHGAPGTQNEQNLWINRFENFRTVTLGQDLKTPFTVNDIIRFMTTIIDYMRPAKGKPGPAVNTIKGAIVILYRYGRFTYPELSVTPHWRGCLRIFLAQRIENGRLTRGHWFQKDFIGFITLSRMS